MFIVLRTDKNESVFLPSIIDVGNLHKSSAVYNTIKLSNIPFKMVLVWSSWYRAPLYKLGIYIGSTYRLYSDANIWTTKNVVEWVSLR